MKSLIKRYQIPVFFVVTLIIGWFPWYTGRGGIIIVAPTLGEIDDCLGTKLDRRELITP